MGWELGCIHSKKEHTMRRNFVRSTTSSRYQQSQLQFYSNLTAISVGCYYVCSLYIYKEQDIKYPVLHCNMYERMEIYFFLHVNKQNTRVISGLVCLPVTLSLSCYCSVAIPVSLMCIQCACARCAVPGLTQHNTHVLVTKIYRTFLRFNECQVPDPRLNMGKGRK